MQFHFLQSFYLLSLKIILWLMNYGIWWSTFGNGEIKVLKLVNKYIKNLKSPIIFDVWANIWQYLDDINMTITKESTIYSFEPQKKAFNELRKKKFENTIHVINTINIWFGEKKEILDIYSESNENKDDQTDSCASIIPENITGFLSKNTIKESISIDTIDDFCKRSNIKRIHFLKIDVEGFEFKCILWAQEMIKNKWIDIIQIEHNRCAIASRIFLKDYRDMFSWSYVICRPLSNNKWLYAIKQYDIYLENFTYINYVMIRKDIYKEHFL